MIRTAWLYIIFYFIFTKTKWEKIAKIKHCVVWSRIKLLDRMVGQCSFWPHFEWKNIHYRPTIKLPNESFPFFLTFTFSTKMKSKFLSCLENIVPDSSKNVAQFVVIVLRWISQKNIKEKGHFPYFGNNASKKVPQHRHTVYVLRKRVHSRGVGGLVGQVL